MKAKCHFEDPSETWVFIELVWGRLIELSLDVFRVFFGLGQLSLGVFRVFRVLGQLSPDVFHVFPCLG